MIERRTRRWESSTRPRTLLAEHNETIDSGIDQAASFVNEKTGGQHGEQIAGASDTVKDKIDEFAGTSPVAPEADPLAHDEPIAQPDPGQPSQSG